MGSWLNCFVLAVVSITGGLVLGGMLAYVVFHYMLTVIITTVLACIIALTVSFHKEAKDG